jgi:transposase InsO family protein
MLRRNTMMRNKLKWLLPLVLAGTFATASAAAFAQEPYARAAASNRVDRRQDRRALRRQGLRVVRRQRKFRADVRNYGPNSRPARVDRRRLARTRHQFTHQARDLRRDRREAIRR